MRRLCSGSVRLEGDTESLMDPALAPTMSQRDRNLRVSSYLFLAFCERPPWLGCHLVSMHLPRKHPAQDRQIFQTVQLA